MMRVVAAILAALFACPAFASVPQRHVIEMSHGGIINDFAEMYYIESGRGDSFKIDGPCLSACTLILGIIPNDRVCITRNAVMGFHSASFTVSGKFAPEATRLLWEMYPDEIKHSLIKKGWRGPQYSHQQLIFIGYDELKNLYRTCE